VRAEILEAGFDLVPHMVKSSARDQHVTRLCHALETSRDVDCITIEIAAFDHDVAEVDADAQKDGPVFGNIGIGFGHLLLQLDGAFDGVDRAPELDQHAVAGYLENAALMSSDDRLQHLFPSGLQNGHRADLIPLHEPAIADHIGGEDGGKATFHCGLVQQQVCEACQILGLNRSNSESARDQLQRSGRGPLMSAADSIAFCHTHRGKRKRCVKRRRRAD
jgi:hypothetical protein